MTATARLTLSMHGNELKGLTDGSSLQQCHHVAGCTDGKIIALVLFLNFQAWQNAAHTSKLETFQVLSISISNFVSSLHRHKQEYPDVNVVLLR